MHIAKQFDSIYLFYRKSFKNCKAKLILEVNETHAFYVIHLSKSIRLLSRAKFHYIDHPY